MKGIVKLKVPPTEITPKLFVITLKRDNVQVRVCVVHYDLVKAITSTWYKDRLFTLREYVIHSELSIDEINNKFKSFNP